jgi:hypothetical protein
VTDKTIRQRWANPGSSKTDLPAVAIALMMAWGARFSEHPIIVQDREESSRGLKKGRKRSRLVELLASRYERIVECDALYRTYDLQSMLGVLGLGTLKCCEWLRLEEKFGLELTSDPLPNQTIEIEVGGGEGLAAL